VLAAQNGLSDDIVLRQIHRANLEEIRMVSSPSATELQHR